MTRTPRILPAVFPLLLLALVAVSGSPAYAIRVPPPPGDGSPIDNTPTVEHGSPFWVFLLVAVISVVLTLVISWQVTRSRHNAQKQVAATREPSLPASHA